MPRGAARGVCSQTASGTGLRSARRRLPHRNPLAIRVAARREHCHSWPEPTADTLAKPARRAGPTGQELGTAVSGDQPTRTPEDVP